MLTIRTSSTKLLFLLLNQVKKLRKIQLNLRWKIFIVVTIGLLFAYGTIGAIRIYQVKSSFYAQIDRSGQERASLIADAVANMIVGYDYSNLESVANRIVNFQDIRKINIFNRDGKLMVTSNTRDLTSDEIDPGSPSAFFAAPVYFSGEKVGSVELFVSRDRFDELIHASYINIFVAILFSTIFFGILIYSTVSVLIVRPLLRLSKAADKLALGDYFAELPARSRDEIGNLVRAFSDMRESRKESEARLQAIFDNSPDAFIQLDFNGSIIDWNDKAVSVWGYQKNEVMGKNFSIVMPDSVLGLNTGYRECYQKSEYIIGMIREVVGQRKDGSFFPLELRTSEIAFEHDSAYLVLARDITERKENENKLLSAMKVAEAANVAKSAFLSNMSHEIRTPMNSIIGMTKLALKTHLNAKQHDYLNKIDYSATHLLGLINSILDFSKIEANKLELELMDFEVNSLFERLYGQLVHTASSKKLHINFDLDQALPKTLRGDPTRLSQVLLNLIGNAIKFTDKGNITISGKLQEENEISLLVRFEVSDQGIGISKDVAEKLFQPFHQADSSTTRRYGGTGLGLAICKQLVELMQGTIGVESQSGVGSKFWFTARLAKGDKENANFHSVLHPDMSLLNGVSVLLVEDNDFNQQVAIDLMHEVGIDVHLAGNGQVAIDMLSLQSFDCVLMDVQMPVMDGLEATRLIRNNPAMADTYIIAMTANARKEDRERCFAAGMNNFVTKPIYADVLYAAIVRGMNSIQPDKVARHGFDSTSQEILDMKTVNLTGASHSEVSLHSELLDLSVLGKMLGHDPAKVRIFALKFLDSSRLGMDEIEAALRDENMAMLAALGHRNKSPARTVGAFAYADLCQSLEQFKDGGDIEMVKQIVTQMRQLIEQIGVEIKKDYVAHQ